VNSINTCHFVIIFRRYSAKTLECLANMPADGLTDICYDIVTSLIQHIILYKPVSQLLQQFSDSLVLQLQVGSLLQLLISYS